MTSFEEFHHSPVEGIRFVVRGKPVSKQRPRFSRGRTYTPTETVQGEKSVREAYSLAATHDGITEKFTGDITIECRFYLPDRRRRDLDNLYKLVTDALNGVAYPDDSQIQRGVMERYYTTPDEARTEVHLTGRKILQ